MTQGRGVDVETPLAQDLGQGRERVVAVHQRRDQRPAHLHAGDQNRARVHTEAALRWLREAMNLLGQN